MSSWKVDRDVVSGTCVITVEGKLRGSRARQLAEQLEELAAQRRHSTKRVVLDLRTAVSVDSVGLAAFEAGLASGLRLDLVVRPGFELDDGREAGELARKGLKVHRTIESALGVEPVLAGV